MKHFRFLAIFLFLLFVIVPAVSAQEYTVRSGYDNPPPADAMARTPQQVSFFELPLWVILAQLAFGIPELLLFLKLWAWFGIRRVSGGNVLEQDVRARIYEYIRKNPGIHLRGLAEEMGISMGTLRYHLNMLRLTHKITINEDVASVRFYENNGTYSPAEQQVFKHLRNETTRKILAILIDKPAATRAELASEIGITGPSITWHMKRLEGDNIISTRRDGRTIVYEIPAPIAGYLSREIRSLADARAALF